MASPISPSPSVELNPRCGWVAISYKSWSYVGRYLVPTMWWFYSSSATLELGAAAPWQLKKGGRIKKKVWEPLLEFTSSRADNCKRGLRESLHRQQRRQQMRIHHIHHFLFWFFAYLSILLIFETEMILTVDGSGR